MLRKITTPIKAIEIFLLIIGYFLGLAISHYLGFPPDWSGFWNGMMSTLFTLLGVKLIGNYFRFNSISVLSNRSNLPNDRTELIEYRNAGNISLLAGIAFIAVSIIPVFPIIKNHSLNIINLMVFSLGLFLLGLVEVLPDQVSKWGMLEIFKAFFYANLIPALAFTLQTGSLHRMVFLLTFPLFFLFVSFFIASTLPAVQDASDVSSQTLIARFGASTILRFHNASLLMGFLFFLLGTFFDLPWRIIWPGLLTMPLGLMQIWQVNQILRGTKPNFKALELTAVAIIIFTSFSLIVRLWLN